MDKLFQETQYFRKPILYIVIGTVWILAILLFYFENLPLLPYIISSATFLAMSVLLYLTRLSITVQPDLLTIVFFPFFVNKGLRFNQISSIAIHPISPLFDYGGWGYRILPFRKTRAYIAQGNMGVTITLKDRNRKIVSSLKDAAGFRDALQQAGFAGELSFK